MLVASAGAVGWLRITARLNNPGHAHPAQNANRVPARIGAVPSPVSRKYPPAPTVSSTVIAVVGAKLNLSADHPSTTRDVIPAALPPASKSPLAAGSNPPATAELTRNAPVTLPTIAPMQPAAASTSSGGIEMLLRGAPLAALAREAG